MSRSTMLWVAVGGAVGASVRWALTTQIASGDFPWATLVANVVGAGLLGWLMASMKSARGIAFGATGFCGGLTTMSTLSLEVARFVDDSRLGMGAGYLVASMVLGLGAWWAGRRLGLGGETL